MKIYHHTKELANKTYRLASKSYQRLQIKLKEYRYMIIIYLICVCSLCLLGIVLLLVVKVRTETFTLGYQISRLEKEKYELQEEIAALTAQWEKKTQFESLIQINQEKEFGLVAPEIWMKKEEAKHK